MEFLNTAQALLASEPQSVPRLGEVVAYCIREALKEIPKASGVGDAGRWSGLVACGGGRGGSVRVAGGLFR